MKCQKSGVLGEIIPILKISSYFICNVFKTLRAAESVGETEACNADLQASPSSSARPMHTASCTASCPSSGSCPAELERGNGTSKDYFFVCQFPYLSNHGTNYMPLNFLPDFVSPLYSLFSLVDLADRCLMYVFSAENDNTQISVWVFALVQQNCHNKILRTGWLKQQKYIFSLFWRLPVQARLCFS